MTKKTTWRCEAMGGKKPLPGRESPGSQKNDGIERAETIYDALHEIERSFGKARSSSPQKGRRKRRKIPPVSSVALRALGQTCLRGG